MVFFSVFLFPFALFIFFFLCRLVFVLSNLSIFFMECEYYAMHLPSVCWNFIYIFSSHCIIRKTNWNLFEYKFWNSLFQILTIFLPSAVEWTPLISWFFITLFLSSVKFLHIFWFNSGLSIPLPFCSANLFTPQLHAAIMKYFIVIQDWSYLIHNLCLFMYFLPLLHKFMCSISD